MKIVFATYNIDSAGKKQYNFTAYRKFSYFGKFNNQGKWGFWYHNIEGWLMSMDVRGDSIYEKVKNFEERVRQSFGAKVIWINGGLIAYKLSNGKTVIR